MAHDRAADDFNTIRARLEELRRDRANVAHDDEDTHHRSLPDRDTARNLEQELIQRRLAVGRPSYKRY